MSQHAHPDPSRPAIGGSLAGCSDSGAASGALTFVYYGDAELQKDYDKLFAKFRTDHPDITLKAQGIASNSWADFANAVSTRLAGGQPLDVVQIATEGQRIFASKGLLEPLDPYIQRNQAEVDAYYQDTPPQLKQWLSQYASPDGKTYYMPGGYNTMALYVDSKIFSKAGVEVPEQWTWEEFRDIGKTIKAKTGAFLTSVGSGYFTDVMPWLLTNGASTFDEKWSTATFDSGRGLDLRAVAGGRRTGAQAGRHVRRADRDVARQTGQLRRRTVANQRSSPAEGAGRRAVDQVAEADGRRFAGRLGRLADPQGCEEQGCRLDLDQIPDLRAVR
jgi:hypothetical protein